MILIRPNINITKLIGKKKFIKFLSEKNNALIIFRIAKISLNLFTFLHQSIKLRL